MPISCLHRRCATWAGCPRRRCADGPNYSAQGTSGGGIGPLGLAPVCAFVLPLPRDRAVHALHLAVLPGVEGPRVDVARPGGIEEDVELPAPVAGSVVGHDALDGHAQAREEAQGAAHERRAGPLSLVGQQLGIGDAAEFVDRVVHHGRLVEFGGPSHRLEESLMLGKSGR